jgi:hypothetical protein
MIPFYKTYNLYNTYIIQKKIKSNNRHKFFFFGICGLHSATEKKNQLTVTKIFGEFKFMADVQID